MPQVIIEYTVTDPNADPLLVGTVAELRFDPHSMPRPSGKAHRIDAKGIGVTESTYLYREPRIRISVRCIPLGTAALGEPSGVNDFEQFYASASDGQALAIDADALPHYTGTFAARLSAGDFGLTPSSQAAKFSETSFELELPRVR